MLGSQWQGRLFFFVWGEVFGASLCEGREIGGENVSLLCIYIHAFMLFGLI